VFELCQRGEVVAIPHEMPKALGVLLHGERIERQLEDVRTKRPPDNAGGGIGLLHDLHRPSDERGHAKERFQVKRGRERAILARGRLALAASWDSVAESSWAVGRRLLLQKGQPALTGFRRRAMPPQAECRASACGACAGNRWGSSGGWSETTKNPSKRVCARLWVPARDVIVHDFVIDLLMSP